MLSHSINDIDGTISLENIKGKAIVVDEFVKPHEHMVIEAALLGNDFPWAVGEGDVSGAGDAEWNHRDIYFYHSLFDRYAMSSEWLSTIHPIIGKLNPMALVRVRANLDIGRSVAHQHGFHHDFDNVVSAVYYVNTNNGGTLFDNGDFVESKANRIVIFDSNLKHTGQTPTDVRSRFVLNINYLPSEDERIKIEGQV